MKILTFRLHYRYDDDRTADRWNMTDDLKWRVLTNRSVSSFTESRTCELSVGDLRQTLYW
jgi:hypothetical protein